MEVSKHTEGSRDKMVRPNGLPESLIRYDGIYCATSSLFLSYLVGAHYLLLGKKEPLMKFGFYLNLVEFHGVG